MGDDSVVARVSYEPKYSKTSAASTPCFTPTPLRHVSVFSQPKPTLRFTFSLLKHSPLCIPCMQFRSASSAFFGLKIYF
jgi:hypothetical protein